MTDPAEHTEPVVGYVTRPDGAPEPVEGTVSRRASWRKWIDNRSQKTLLIGAAILLLVCVLTSLVVAALALASGTAQTNAAADRATGNAERIDDLQAQLATAAAEIDASRSADAARLACDLLFSEASESAFRDYQSHFGQLLILVANLTPGDERAAASATPAADLQTALATSLAVAAQRSAYIAAGRPLPCPLATVAPTDNTTTPITIATSPVTTTTITGDTITTEPTTSSTAAGDNNPATGTTTGNPDPDPAPDDTDEPVRTPRPTPAPDDTDTPATTPVTVPTATDPATTTTVTAPPTTVAPATDPPTTLPPATEPATTTVDTVPPTVADTTPPTGPLP